MKNGRRTLKDRLREDLRDPEIRKAFNAEDLPARLAIQIARSFGVRYGQMTF